MGRRLAALLALALVGVLAFVDARPPSPVAADAPPGEFSAERAAETVTELAREPRPIGSTASDRVRDELVRRLSAAGLTTRVQAAVGTSTRAGAMTAGAVENVIARLPGTAPTGTVVLAAHYDSVARGPGAADDTSSVAAILEAVRTLRTGPPLRNDLVVLITDGEESGLLGAQAWVRDELARDRRPTVTLNFEARGTAGPSLMFQTSPGNDELVRALADAVPHPTGDSSLVEFYRLLPNDTDLSTVLAAGRAGMNFAFVERPVDYHTAQDSPSNLDPASVQGHGDAALALSRTLGQRDLAPLDLAVPGAGDRTYFRFLAAMITYPSALVWPLAALALVALAGSVAVARARRLLSVRGTLAAIGAVLLAAAVGVGAAVGMWRGIVALRPSYADTGPFLARPLPFQLAAVALAAAVVAAWFVLLRRRPGPFAASAGACLVFVVAGLVTASVLPGLSFLFAVPALGLGIGLGAVALLRDRPVAATAAATLAAVPTVAVLVPFAWASFALAGISNGLPTLVAVLTLAASTIVLVPGSRIMRDDGGSAAGSRRRPDQLAAPVDRRSVRSAEGKDRRTDPSVAGPGSRPVPSDDVPGGRPGPSDAVPGGRPGPSDAVPGGRPVPSDAVAVGRAGPERRRGWAAPVAALALSVALAVGGVVADRPTADHPQSTSLAFLQDADTGVATWVSADTDPADWTRRYVSSPPVALPAWTGPGPVRTGPAPPLDVPGPSVTVLERTAQQVVLQVASPRGAPTVQLRADRPLESVTVTFPGRPAVTGSATGGQVRLAGVPPAGVRVALTPPIAGLTVSDLSDGLDGIPGFVPRPPELRGAANRTSDQVVVTRRVPG